MSNDTSWDIEQYKTKFESEEHWALKKEFMEAHKELFSEERLICLAQVYVNIELLRCKYPDALMRQVAELAKGIGRDYKARQKQLLQRTFVKASDAASAKAKGLKRSLSQLIGESRANDTSMKQQCEQAPNKYQLALLKGLNNPSPSHSPQLQSIQSKPNVFTRLNSRREAPAKPDSSLTQNDPYAQNLFLVRITYAHYAGAFQFLQHSISFSNLTFREVYDTDYSSANIVCKLFASGKGVDLYLGVGEGKTQKNAKKAAADNSMEMLLQKCYVLKVLKRSSSDGEVALKDVCQDVKDTEGNKLADDSVGAKLLKMMGWSGGALGKSGTGIIEPVQASSVIGRRGLGLNNEVDVTPQFVNAVKTLLTEFRNKEDMSDLVFTADLSPDQRKRIHMLCVQIGRGKLKSVSHGKGDSRYLVISHKISSTSLIQKITAHGGSTDKYELVEPGTLTLQSLCEVITGT